MVKIDIIIKTVSIFSLLVIASVLGIYSFFFAIDVYLLLKLGVLAILTLIPYLIWVSIQEAKHIEKSESSFTDIVTKIENTDTNIKETHTKVEEIGNKTTEMKKNLALINQTQTEVIIKSEWFYILLAQMRDKAKHRVQLTQLDPGPPDVYGDKTRKEYFDKTVIFAREHPHVKVQRIMSIPSPKKLDWARETIESSSDVNNLHLAYIRIDDISDTTPTPPILSLQIIDEEEMLLLDLRYSYMPMNFKPCLYFRDKEAVKTIFSAYYDTLWERIERDNVKWKHSESDHDKLIGFILKDGMDTTGYKEKLGWISNLIGQERKVDKKEGVSELAQDESPE